MRFRTGFIFALAILAALLLVGRAASALVVDHAWYVALGAPEVFWERLTDRVALQGIAWLAGFLFTFANIHAVRQTILAVAVPSRMANLELTWMLPPRRLFSITLVLSAAIGLVLALPLTDWTVVAMARHGVPFDEIEGILNHDLGFFVYRLPLEETLYLWVLATLILMIAVVSMLYALTRSLRFDGRRIVASTHVRRHFSALGAMVLCLLAWSYRLDGFDLLRRGSGPEGLFLRLDHVVSLQVDRVLVVVCAIAAPIFLRAGWIGHLRSAFVTLSLVLVAAIGGRLLLPIVLLRSDLVGEPARRDEPYLATRTLFSRRAFDVDGLQSAAGDSLAPRQSRVRTRLTGREIGANASLWDADAIRANLTDDRRPQPERTSVGWTRLADGRLGAVAVRGPGAPGGFWTLSIADATVGMLRDSAVSTVFGDDFDDAVGDAGPLVAPGERGARLVMDAPGVIGTPIRSLGLRIAHAWDTRDPSLLQPPTGAGSAPRLIAYRDVRERIARLAPVFAQGEEVQPILHEETLYWAVHVYSASDRFPLSQHQQLARGSYSYFRLAATALIDASTGRVRFVPVDRPDPIARSWLGRIPALVVATSDLAPGLLDLLPPPTDGALAQLRAFARYGSRLEGNVPRRLPDSLFVGASPPIHLVAAGTSVAPGWSVPLLGAGEQIDGVFTAVGGAVRGVVWDSTTVPRSRWNVQVERLRSVLDSSRASFPGGTRREPRIRIGPLHVVSGQDGPVLIQPLFATQPDGHSVVARVAVMQGTRVEVGTTVAGAIAAIGGEVSPSGSARSWPYAAGSDRDARIARLYDAMREAMRRGDWSRFGAYFDSLGLVMGRPPE